MEIGNKADVSDSNEFDAWDQNGTYVEEIFLDANNTDCLPSSDNDKNSNQDSSSTPKVIQDNSQARTDDLKQKKDSSPEEDSDDPDRILVELSEPAEVENPQRR